MDNIIECKLDSAYKEIYTGIWQHDYGQILRITGVDLPKAVEVQFSLRDKGGDTLTRIGTTVDGVTEVKVPDSFLKNENCTQNYLIYAWIYVTDDTSGNTEYQIILHVKSRPKPEEPTEEPLPEPNIFHETVEAVNAAADRAEMAEQNANDSASKAEEAAASASASAKAAENTKTEALEEIGNKKQDALSSIQAKKEESLSAIRTQEENSVSKVTEHTNEEIQRFQNAANEAKGALDRSIEEAGEKKTALDGSIRTADSSKANLDESVESAGTAKSGLDASTGKAKDAKTELDGSIRSAGEKQLALDTTVEHANTVDASLKEHIGSAEQIQENVEQIAKNKADISSLKEDTTALQKRQNVLVGSETGNPVTVDDAFAAQLCGLNVYGKSTQDGTPSPDNPVPIVSAGDGGSVAVKVTGKNRMPPNLKRLDFVDCFVKKNTPITLVFKGDLVSQGGNILFFDENNNFNWFGINKGKAEHHIRYPVDLTKFQYLLDDMASENVCLTLNASSPDYEPYREQLLTLPTPNGLPGIPVTSGGNYTDPQGQQWICDEVDLERGLKVQRVNKVEVDGETAKFEQTGNYANLSLRGIPIALYDVGQRIFATSTFAESPWYYNTKNGQFLYLIAPPDMSDKLNVSCKKQLGKIYYALATPIETPLTPAEIAAYKALTAYAPDTVVQASDGAGIRLGYQRDVNLVVKNLEDAIASMTTT